MPVAPIFQTRVDLLAALRLGPASLAAGPVIDAGILASRSEFWRRLQQARIDQILVTAFTDTPITDAQHLRVLAVLTEQMVVRSELMLTLTTGFKDGSAAFLQEWNDEAAFRNQNSFSKDSDRDTLQLKIDQNFAVLQGDQTVGDESRIRGVTIGPNDDDDPYLLGERIFKSPYGIFQ